MCVRAFLAQVLLLLEAYAVVSDDADTRALAKLLLRRLQLDVMPVTLKALKLISLLLRCARATLQATT